MTDTRRIKLILGYIALCFLISYADILADLI